MSALMVRPETTKTVTSPMEVWLPNVLWVGKDGKSAILLNQWIGGERKVLTLNKVDIPDLIKTLQEVIK